MRFPHLYGPLPTAAVVAVVPYRPPAAPVLPDPDDALGRALALQLSVPVRRAAEVRDVPGGLAVCDPRFAHSRDDNRLLLSSPVDADTVAETAAAVAADAGWPARAATLRFPGAADVARELAGRGWSAEELVVMARAAGPTPGGERAEVVAQEEVHPLWEQSWRELLGSGRDDVVAQLVGREFRNDAVVAVTDVVVREEGRVVAAGQLRVDGGTAAVDSVLTARAARGRGYAGAVLARILTLAAESGCDLVVLEAGGDDWPRHWYARHGFAELGSTWDVSAPGSR
jgi:GNAT superfamily N-acetyltransferase